MYFVRGSKHLLGCIISKLLSRIVTSLDNFFFLLTNEKCLIVAFLFNLTCKTLVRCSNKGFMQLSLNIAKRGFYVGLVCHT